MYLEKLAAAATFLFAVAPAQDLGRAAVSGTVGDGVTRVTLGPDTSYAYAPLAESPVGTDGRFALECEIPAPIVLSLSTYDGRRRTGTLPVYVTPGAAVTVGVAGRDSTFAGDGALENAQLYDCLLELRKHVMLDNREADPARTAEFLDRFAARLTGSDGALTPACRDLLTEVAAREVQVARQKALAQRGGEPYLDFLRSAFADPPATPAYASVRDWHERLANLTAAFATAGLLGDGEAGERARVAWVTDPTVRSGLCVFLLERAVEGKRWFRDPLRPRMLPLAEYLVGARDRAGWDAKLARLAELERDFAHLAVGEPAPDFRLEDVDGAMVSLADFRGRFVVLDIWNLACVPCIAEIPHIRRVEGELADAGIVFVSVSADEQADQERWRTFVREREMTGTQLIVDEGRGSAFLRDYRIKGFPTFCVIDPAGRIADPFFVRPSDPAFVPSLRAMRRAAGSGS